MTQAIWILPIILACASFCQANLEVVYEWKYIDYVWEDDAQKTEAVDTGNYDYKTIITNDFQPLSDGRVLVTTPRYYDNPASLSTISNKTDDGGPLLAPYPDWSWHQSDDCSGIISVNRLFLDDCNRLWLVDSGKIVNEQVCPAKILAFDPETDELIKELEIPSNLSHSPDDPSKGRLEIQAVETTEELCEQFWVYISDLDGNGILIWDGSDIWRLDDEIFSPTTDAEIFNIDGENFTLPGGGPEGLLLTPPGYLEQTYLILKPLASIKTFAASTEDLHNSKFGYGVKYYKTSFTAPSQEPAKIFSKNGGVLIANFVSKMALGCWNIQNPLDESHVTVVVQNETTLQYVSSNKISADPENGLETVWITTNRLQKYILGTIDFTEINYRIMVADVANLVEGTVCEPQNYTTANSIEEKDFFYLKTA